MDENLYGVIMAGGAGTRLWPMSRQDQPKQFIDFFGSGTMIQQTLHRIEGLVSKENILVVTNEAGDALVRKQLPIIPAKNIIVEPAAKNTAPCIALASAIIRKRNPNAVVMILPSDHIIADLYIFHQTLRAAVELAKKTLSLVMIGISPTKPETGYGYIQRASINPENESVEKDILEKYGIASYKIQTFTEKPDAETAKAFLKSGGFYWNSGMFIWHIDAIWREFEKTMPHLFEDMNAMYRSIGTSDEEDVIRKSFTWIKPTSIDYGVMEKASSVYMVEGLFSWSDAGSWDELVKLSQIASSSFPKSLILKDAKNVSFLKTSGSMHVAVIGVEDIIVVETKDAILICKKGESQKVRDVVSSLKEHGLYEYL